MKLYALSDGPPSLAVRMVMKALDLEYEYVAVDYNGGEHLRDDYAQINPQKEVPVLDDDGFILGESIAIMQYLCDQYGSENPIYPTDPKERALVNHRMLFNMSYYYANVSPYALAPIWFDYPRSDFGKMKLDMALGVFETYLNTTGTKYAAGDAITIADMALMSTTLVLEACEIEFDNFPLVTTWYETFKEENPELWDIAEVGIADINAIFKSPPDVSQMNHPIHPMRKDSVFDYVP